MYIVVLRKTLRFCDYVEDRGPDVLLPMDFLDSDEVSVLADLLLEEPASAEFAVSPRLSLLEEPASQKNTTSVPTFENAPPALPKPLPLPAPPTVTSLPAATSSVPCVSTEEKETFGGAAGDFADDPSDPKEIKKQKRLIRNRMSAQLHRERKRAYIDKLEGEVKDRDGTIAVLQNENARLQNENARLRRLLENHGIEEGAVSAASAEVSDLGSTTNSDDSEGSDGTMTPPPPRKRGASPTPSAMKSARLSGTGFLAAFACLMVFRSPNVLQRFLLPSSLATTPSTVSTQVASSSVHRSGGRVLMSVLEGEESKSVEAGTATHVQDSTLALSLVPALLPLTIPESADEESPDHERSENPLFENPLMKAKLSLNSSYLFCPSMIQTSSDWRQQAPLNSSEGKAGHENEKPRRHGLRHQKSTTRDAVKRNPAESTAVVATSSSQAKRATSVAITKLLLSRPLMNQLDENSTVASNGASDGSLVLRGAAGSGIYREGAGGTGPHHDSSESEDPDGSFPQLMLVVPSSSLEGFSDSFDPQTARSSWVEIGCRMHSARFVDFSQ